MDGDSLVKSTLPENLFFFLVLISRKHVSPHSIFAMVTRMRVHSGDKKNCAEPQLAHRRCGGCVAPKATHNLQSAERRWVASMLPPRRGTDPATTRWSSIGRENNSGWEVQETPATELAAGLPQRKDLPTLGFPQVSAVLVTRTTKRW